MNTSDIGRAARLSLRTALTLALCAGLASAPACGERRTPELDREVRHLEHTHLPGIIRFDDENLRVASVIIHNAQLDLVTHCRAKVAGSLELPEPAVLCFDEERRSRDEVRRILIERDDRRTSIVMRALAADDEGAHFLIERGGGLQQILDLALPARRGGEYRRDEVRILSQGPRHEPALIEALKGLFPGAELELVRGPVGPGGDEYGASDEAAEAESLRGP